jgi:hypothetical protein
MGKYKHTCTISFVIDSDYDDPHIAVQSYSENANVVRCLMVRVAELACDQDKFERDLRLFQTVEGDVITQLYANVEDR